MNTRSWDNEEQSQAVFQKKLKAIQDAQIDNYQESKILNQIQVHIEELSLRSQRWLEDYENIVPKNKEALAKAQELWAEHEYSAQNFNASLEESFYSNLQQKALLEKQKEELISEYKNKSLQLEKREKSGYGD